MGINVSPGEMKRINPTPASVAANLMQVYPPKLQLIVSYDLDMRRVHVSAHARVISKYINFPNSIIVTISVIIFSMPPRTLIKSHWGNSAQKCLLRPSEGNNSDNGFSGGKPHAGIGATLWMRVARIEINWISTLI